MRLLRTNQSITLLWHTIYFWALEPLQRGFCSYTRKRFSDKPIFLRRNYYLINYGMNGLFPPLWFRSSGWPKTITVCFWYLVKWYLSSVHVYSSVHWTSHFIQGTTKTCLCLTGHPVGEGTDFPVIVWFYPNLHLLTIPNLRTIPMQMCGRVIPS